MAWTSGRASKSWGYGHPPIFFYADVSTIEIYAPQTGIGQAAVECATIAFPKNMEAMEM
jgi:hypothetical protein